MQCWGITLIQVAAHPSFRPDSREMTSENFKAAITTEIKENLKKKRE